MKFRELEKVFSRYLSYEHEPDFLKVIMATVIANRLDTVPVWLLIIAPASSGKTTILETLDAHPEVHMTSMITKASLLISNDKDRHKKKTKDESLLKKIDGKILVIKDASTLMQMHESERSGIFSNLRDAFDGNFDRDTSTGHNKAKAKFGFIMGATADIESWKRQDATLGERFLTFRPYAEMTEDIWDKIREQREAMSEMKMILSDATCRFLSEFRTPEKVEFPQELEDTSKSLVILRTMSRRNPVTGELMEPIKIAEMPMRCYRQMCALYTCLYAITRSRKESMTISRRIARDSIPSIRHDMLSLIMEGYDTRAKIAKKTGMNLKGIVFRCLIDDMLLLNILREDEAKVSANSDKRYDMINNAKLSVNQFYANLFLVSGKEYR